MRISAGLFDSPKASTDIKAIYWGHHLIPLYKTMLKQKGGLSQ